VPSVFPALAALLAFLAHLASAAAPAPQPPLSHLIGQKLVVRVDARRIRSRIRRGEVGGVILYRGRNFTTRGGLRSIAATLQRAADAGGRPPLLIAVDQEGGAVKQVPWAPPTLSAPAMGAGGRRANRGPDGRLRELDAS